MKRTLNYPTKFGLSFIALLSFLSSCDGFKANSGANSKNHSSNLLSNSRTDATVPVWNIYEISLTSESNVDIPFRDIEAGATFTGPKGIKIVRPAFWDGDKSWKIRFAPTLEGEWSYVTWSTQNQDNGLNGKTGVITAVPYEGTIATFKHGFPKSTTKHYLAYQDNTPFFWMGNDMTMIDVGRLTETNKYDWNPKPNHSDSQVYGAIENMAIKQFNVINFTFFSKFIKHTSGEYIPDVSRFQTFYDPIMKFSVDQGFTTLLTMGYPNEMSFGLPTSLRYARYLIARYGAYPVVWSFSEMDSPYTTAGYADKWGQVGSYAASIDSYHHPIGPIYWHTTQYNQVSTLYLNQSWVNLIINQCGHQLSPTNYSLGGFQESWKYQYYINNFPNISIVEAGGCNFEQIYSGVDTYLARRSAWRAFLAGSAGFGYGAEGIWNLNWDPSHPTMNYGSKNLPWYQGIDLLGSWHMAFMKYFVDSIPWHNMSTRNGTNGIVTWSDDGNLTDIQKPLVRADSGEQIVLAYLPRELPFNAFVPGNYSSSGEIRGLTANSYTAEWYNPRSGKFTLIDYALKPTNGKWSIPLKPDVEDLVLWINANPIGTLDSIANGVVYGWALHPSYPESQVEIHVYIDGAYPQGTFIGNAYTDTVRDDVNSAYAVEGKHGFRFQIPEKYNDGKNHNIYVHAMNRAPNSNNALLWNTPKTAYPW
jgi:hypothetical protein